MNIDIIEQFAIDQVRILRLKSGLSQREIGEIINASTSFVCNVESPKNPAKYNLRHIRLIADHFKVSPKDFIMQ